MPYDQVLPKFESGKLRSGSGDKVTKRKQAIAIMLSEKEKAKQGNAEYQSSGMAEAAMKRRKK